MRRIWIFLVVAMVLVGGMGSWMARGTVARAIGEGGPLGDGVAGGAEGVRFVAVDVVMNSGGKGLGAYQVEVEVLPGVEIVGLEGGDAAGFREAPFYDPAALQGRRIVVAAFVGQAGAATVGSTRVARLHLMVKGGVEDARLLAMGTKLVVATDGEGETIAATVSLGIAGREGDKR